MKIRYLALVVLLLTLCTGRSYPVEAQPTQAEEVNVIIIVSNGFGWSYFTAKDCFESWGATVTTVAHSVFLEVPSCYNRDPRPITADILLSDFNISRISEYDCLFIPSGGTWVAMSGSQTVLDFISAGYDAGLVVSTVCIGNVVVGRANEIVAESKVASYPQSNSIMRDAGAVVVSGAGVVSDNRIVTGGTGGGLFSGGYTTAPIAEVCASVMRVVLGYSRIVETTVEPARPEPETQFSISVETTEYSQTETWLNSSDIGHVYARIYSNDNATEVIDTITLTDSDDDGIYTGVVDGLDTGQYVIDIELQDSDDILEVVGEAVGFNIASPFPVVELSIAIGVIGLVAVVSLVVWKRRS
ncbi:MAG: DJ-1/PfpI family protein [Candidatus Thorarchaeota archaeon]|jgi:putative intracellular protease/amidase